MELHLKIIGTLFVCLAALHLGFPKRFKWQTELASLSLLNKQMMQYHTFFIALTVFLMGLLCLTETEALCSDGLGKSISLGLAVFWGLRLVVQLFGYSSALWKGKPFETSIHVLFTSFWIYSTTVFALCFVG